MQLSDTGMWTNQNLSFARATGDMILLAEAILKAALLRNESRGAHYKPEFPERDDANFLKTTIATYDPATGSPQITYGPVDTSLVEPRRARLRQEDRDPRGAGGGRRGPRVRRPDALAGHGRRLNALASARNALPRVRSSDRVVAGCATIRRPTPPFRGGPADERRSCHASALVARTSLPRLANALPGRGTPGTSIQPWPG